MIKAQDVQHKKWTETTVLYDDNVFSVIWGRYDNFTRKTMAMRWNGAQDDPEDVGYPKLFKNPVWFNIPDWQIMGQLIALRSRLSELITKNHKAGEEYRHYLVMLDNIRQAEYDWRAQR
jgi:hypothetical protein